MITVVIISFYSHHHILDRIKEIGSSAPVVIVENSQDFELKKNLESIYPNVKVLIPPKNLGWGKAVNFAIKEINTNYIYLTQPDVILHNDCVMKLEDCVSKFKDFAILTPVDINPGGYKNYQIYSKKENNIIDNKYGLEEVDHVDITWLLNKDELQKIGNWDENIFLYYETFDLCKRFREKHKKIFIIKNIQTSHFIGSKSQDPKLEFQSLLNRNWHYNWSKFYYYQKHYGYFFGVRKTIPNLLRAIKKYIIHKVFIKGEKHKLHYAEISGLLSSYFKKPSSYRPYEKT